MTAHGPAAVALVRAALGPGAIDVEHTTGLALDVIAGALTRDAAIDTLAYRQDLARRYAARLLDLAVEALTAQE